MNVQIICHQCEKNVQQDAFFRLKASSFEHVAEQANCSIGTFAPLSAVCFESLGIQIFPTAGCSYYDGHKPCDTAGQDAVCAGIEPRVDGNCILVATESRSGNLGRWPCARWPKSGVRWRWRATVAWPGLSIPSMVRRNRSASPAVGSSMSRQEKGQDASAPVGTAKRQRTRWVSEGRLRVRWLEGAVHSGGLAPGMAGRHYALFTLSRNSPEGRKVITRRDSSIS